MTNDELGLRIMEEVSENVTKVDVVSPEVVHAEGEASNDDMLDV